tara:strand:+ start:2974 stop:3696 length:723 start_codon:yes stop_codon:yes gene_type:complete
MLLTSKKTGETTSQFSNRIKKHYGFKKLAICGKLDPMARGLTIVLPDKHTGLMNGHLDSDKEYEFNIIQGISTDSDDVLGNVMCINRDRNTEILDCYLENLVYKKTQYFHHYSAKRLSKNGINKPLWYWYKNNQLLESEIPFKKVKVYNVKKLDTQEIDFLEYVETAKKTINTLDSDKFNKKNILNSWDRKGINFGMPPLIKHKYSIRVSSGFYVRMIAKELKELGVCCHIYDINRTAVF